MKQCPTCQAEYHDNTLNFCLNDGTNLLEQNPEQETRVIYNRSTFGQTPQNDFYQPESQSVADARKSGLKLILAGLVTLTAAILIIGTAAYFLLKPQDTPPAANSTANKNSNSYAENELNYKIANLQKQIEEQKKLANQNAKSTTAQTSTTAKTPPALDKNGKATAKVAPTNDGFLSLRTEPSVKTGTQLLRINSGEKVDLENCEGVYQTIDGRRGRWCMVTYAGKTGWVFDGWLIY